MIINNWVLKYLFNVKIFLVDFLLEFACWVVVDVVRKVQFEWLVITSIFYNVEKIHQPILIQIENSSSNQI